MSVDDTIRTYKQLIRSMPRQNQYLLLYVLDLLSVFARKSDINLMTATSTCIHLVCASPALTASLQTLRSFSVPALLTTHNTSSLQLNTILANGCWSFSLNTRTGSCLTCPRRRHLQAEGITPTHPSHLSLTNVPPPLTPQSSPSIRRPKPAGGSSRNVQGVEAALS